MHSTRAAADKAAYLYIMADFRRNEIYILYFSDIIHREFGQISCAFDGLSINEDFSLHSLRNIIRPGQGPEVTVCT
jgi:hypothetical protein